MNNIKSMNDLKAMKIKMPDAKILLLYSGGLDSTFLMTYMKQELDLNITALYIDIGQEEPFSNEDIAKRFCSRVIKSKNNELFINEFVKKAIINQGYYLKRHPLSASLSRPLFASLAVEEAELNDYDAIVHCATSTQNSLRRFNTTITSLNFKGFYGSPFEESTPTRTEKLSFVRSLDISFPIERNFSFDTNLWCREFESGNLSNPESIELEEDFFIWSKKEKNLKPIDIKISFDKGIPFELDDEPMNLEKILQILNYKVGAYGHGRFLSLEESPNGKKVLEARECPGAMFIMESYWELLAASVDQGTQLLKSQLDLKWGVETSEGRWFGDCKKAIEAFNDSVSKKVSGDITFHVSENGFQLLSVRSQNPQYSLDRESDEAKFTILRKVG